MKIGTGIPPSRMDETFREADYMELPARNIAAMTPEEFAALKARVQDGSLKTYSCNCLIPNEFRLIGPEANMAVIREYMKPLTERLAELGISMIVFGSGKAKNVPEDFSREAAWDQLYELGAILADTAAPYGQTVCVEPLSYTETNIVNTVSEGFEYCKTVNRSNFRCLVDFYHFDNNRDDWDSIPALGDWLVHTHIAAPKTRGIPETEAEWAFVRRCFKVLKDMGYTGNLCYEGKYPSGEDMEILLRKFKQEADYVANLNA